MNKTELLDKWKSGCRWLTAHEQITGTNKNHIGEIYDHELYLIGLKKLEDIEDEMQKKKLKYEI